MTGGFIVVFQGSPLPRRSATAVADHGLAVRHEDVLDLEDGQGLERRQVALMQPAAAALAVRPSQRRSSPSPVSTMESPKTRALRSSSRRSGSSSLRSSWSWEEGRAETQAREVSRDVAQATAHRFARRQRYCADRSRKPTRRRARRPSRGAVRRLRRRAPGACRAPHVTPSGTTRSLPCGSSVATCSAHRRLMKRSLPPYTTTVRWRTSGSRSSIRSASAERAMAWRPATPRRAVSRKASVTRPAGSCVQSRSARIIWCARRAWPARSSGRSAPTARRGAAGARRAP